MTFLAVLTPRQTLLHYRLLEPIGEGGMGVVWKAFDTTLERQVALKVLPHELTQNADLLRRFEQEARLLAALNHPNVAMIYGLHQIDAVHFFMMELVDGEDLSTRVKGRALPLATALTIGTQVAAALEATHARGITHRDLKPANIRLTPQGVVKVLDFGAWRRTSCTSRVATTGITIAEHLAIGDAILRAGHQRGSTGLADCYRVLRVYGWMSAADSRPRALEAVTRAMHLDPEERSSSFRGSSNFQEFVLP